MDLLLKRNQWRSDGIFGELLEPSGQAVAVTLEHAYPCGSSFAPKIPAGVYTCVRGPHRLHSMTEDFQTFEITGVEGHSNLLFHWGNFNSDSEGCVLLGTALAAESGSEKIVSSRIAFAKFMAIHGDSSEFTLEVQ